MAVERIVSDEIADQKTFEKIRRELEIRGEDDSERERLEAEMVSVKARMAARL